jgi:hypothetical protein
MPCSFGLLSARPSRHMPRGSELLITCKSTGHILFIFFHFSRLSESFLDSDFLHLEADDLLVVFVSCVFTLLVFSHLFIAACNVAQIKTNTNGRSVETFPNIFIIWPPWKVPWHYCQAGLCRCTQCHLSGNIVINHCMVLPPNGGSQNTCWSCLPFHVFFIT